MDHKKGKQPNQTNEGDSMNVMAQAHKATKAKIAYDAANGLKSAPYAVIFKTKLIQAHKEYKAMQMDPAEFLRLDTIAKFEKRIAELEALKPEIGHRWIVVCGDDHPMPINFESTNIWSNVENATKWSSPQFARANAKRVVNGNKNVGKAVLVADHIAWDIQNLKNNIAMLKKD